MTNRKERMKINAEINETENKRKTNEPKPGYLRRSIQLINILPGHQGK